MEMMTVTLLLAVLCLSCGSVLSSSCSSSPSQWCSSMDSAIQCGVLKQCLEANFTKARHTADAVHLALYYESLCPGCRALFTEVIFPTWNLLQEILTVTLVPYGNARETFKEKKYVFTCQHGEPECLGNMIETCIINMTSSTALQIIYCMESSTDVVGSAPACLQLYSPELKWDSILSCVKGDVGNQLMHQNALQTEALKPPNNYVPWVTINGEHTEELQQQVMTSLFTLVCNMYKGTKPEACGTGEGKRHFRSYCQND
ncbi:gamma-interferon-inducible lysosomal thiol reductase [Genypterus blacodes]|uniref:gamma-interferon-inducible lysosomal thiol reductase n=1 Tax=Genypterus blacodes TaxID=154954 RepID=UPI003F75FD23